MTSFTFTKVNNRFIYMLLFLFLVSAQAGIYIDYVKVNNNDICSSKNSKNLNTNCNHCSLSTIDSLDYKKESYASLNLVKSKYFLTNLFIDFNIRIEPRSNSPPL